MADLVVKLGRDPVGQLAYAQGIVYYLTPCCEASTKGSGDGVVCRHCYQPVALELADAWLVTDEVAWGRLYRTVGLAAGRQMEGQARTAAKEEGR